MLVDWVCVNMCWLDLLQLEERLYWLFRCNNSTSSNTLVCRACYERTRERRTDREVGTQQLVGVKKMIWTIFVVVWCRLIGIVVFMSTQLSLFCRTTRARKTKGGNSRAWTHVQMILVWAWGRKSKFIRRPVLHFSHGSWSSFAWGYRKGEFSYLKLISVIWRTIENGRGSKNNITSHW